MTLSTSTTETARQAERRFEGQGYGGRARREAQAIRFLDDGVLYHPEQVVVEGLARTGQAAREGVVFALYSPRSAQRATLTLGTRGGGEDSDLVTRLMTTMAHTPFC